MKYNTILWIAYFLYAVMPSINRSMPISQNSGTNAPSLSTEYVVNFLVQFGYLDDRRSPVPTNSSAGGNRTDTNTTAGASKTIQSPELYSIVSPYTAAEISQAITDFQAFTNLQKTGTVTAETAKAMTSARCGVRDKDPRAAVTYVTSTHAKRARRFVTEGSKWTKRLIKYSISQPSGKLTLLQQKQLMEAAFRRWAEITPLLFRWNDNPQSSDINIRFASGYHGDAHKFDGPGGVLAHTFYPIFGGDIHFDEEESWDTGLEDKTPNPVKVSLLKVAIHEVGHSIGLGHSSVPNSAMNAYLNSANDLSLGSDDIFGAQLLYDQCETSLDTVFSWMGNRRTYFMKGSSSWRFDDIHSEAERSYPKPISSQWIGVPNDIDEAFLWSANWITYFFKGNQYYRYNDQLDRIENGYPKVISEGWPGVPNNINAAFTMSVDVSYFLKGNLCYKFDNTNDAVFVGYPKRINECFPGLPDNIDTAVRYIWDNVVYFFKGLDYYRLDQKSNTVIGPIQIKRKWRNLCFV